MPVDRAASPVLAYVGLEVRLGPGWDGLTTDDALVIFAGLFYGAFLEDGSHGHLLDRSSTNTRCLVPTSEFYTETN